MSWVDDVYERLNAEQKQQRTTATTARESTAQRADYAKRWWTQFVDALNRYVEDWNEKGRSDAALKVVAAGAPEMSAQIIVGQATQAHFRFNGTDEIRWRRAASPMPGLEDNDQTFLIFRSEGENDVALLAGREAAPEEAAQVVLEPIFRRAFGLTDEPAK
jgi:hypothetical protein